MPLDFECYHWRVIFNLKDNFEINYKFIVIIIKLIIFIDFDKLVICFVRIGQEVLLYYYDTNFS